MKDVETHVMSYDVFLRPISASNMSEAVIKPFQFQPYYVQKSTLFISKRISSKDATVRCGGFNFHR